MLSIPAAMDGNNVGIGVSLVLDGVALTEADAPGMWILWDPKWVSPETRVWGWEARTWT